MDCFYRPKAYELTEEYRDAVRCYKREIDESFKTSPDHVHARNAENSFKSFQEKIAKIKNGEV